jgi:hypothetical protein
MFDTLGYEPRVRPAGEVEAEIAALSSSVLDMVRIRGKVTDGAPMELPWDEAEEPDKYYNITHLWSLYGLGDAALEQGMTALADRLPDNGWTVVKNGPDSSRARNQQILAVHMATRSQLEATRRKGINGREPLIIFSVYSRFFIPVQEPF